MQTTKLLAQRTVAAEHPRRLYGDDKQHSQGARGPNSAANELRAQLELHYVKFFCRPVNRGLG